MPLSGSSSKVQSRSLDNLLRSILHLGNQTMANVASLASAALTAPPGYCLTGPDLGASVIFPVRLTLVVFYQSLLFS